ncbi:MAG: glutamate--tRNA ligase [Patescibacteria group bacterium]|nr:glutamate--tRNA ligase [Patescibacteria group bacterium]
MSTTVRVRFAPSPTGFLHIGNLRVALFDYLTAKTLNGKLILRIEDTDQKREVAGAVDSLIDILNWAGIKFDEGPRQGGNYGPYVQSQRKQIYQEQAAALLKKGGAYRCFCGEDKLKTMREEQQAKKLPPRYDRTCRDLTDKQALKKVLAGEKFVIRQKMPLSGEIIVHDELRGDIKFQAGDLEDHVLIKSDGLPTYQFANIVDDHLMAISHVLRGDEWLSSFPKNVLLYQAFNWQPPKFIHLPLIINKDGGKLSKRQGDVAVEDFKNKGYLSEALINFIVLLGWHPSASDKMPREKTDEILSQDEMIKYFDYQDIGTSPAIFDVEKLDYFNGYYIRQMSLEKLSKLCLPFLGANLQLTSNPKKQAEDYIKQVVALEQERLKRLAEIGELTKFMFADDLEYGRAMLIWKKLDFVQVKANLQTIFELLEKIPQASWQGKTLETAIMNYLKTEGLKTGDYLWPMRVALTGLKASPGPFEVAGVLGKEESLQRINQAIKKLG